MMKFLVTGSQVYGPKTQSSDLDLVIDISGANKIKDFLSIHKIDKQFRHLEQDYSNDSFYFSIGGIVVNIIVVLSDDEFNLWDERTERMKTFPPVVDRQERIKVFRGGENTE